MFEDVRDEVTTAAGEAVAVFSRAVGQVAAWAPGAEDSPVAVLEVAAVIESVIAAAQAVRTVAIAQAVRFGEPTTHEDGTDTATVLPAGQVARYGPDAVAAQLGWGVHAADRRVGTAVRVATAFPGLLGQLGAGQVSMEG